MPELIDVKDRMSVLTQVQRAVTVAHLSLSMMRKAAQEHHLVPELVDASKRRSAKKGLIGISQPFTCAPKGMCAMRIALAKKVKNEKALDASFCFKQACTCVPMRC